MLLTGLSLAGWIHSIACLIALVTGACVLVARKGTPRHRLWGWWYAGVMVVMSLTVMAVYRFDVLFGRPPRTGPHIFGVFHWLALTSLAAVLLAVFAASRQRRLVWAHMHAQAMLFSYYLLIGGLINELLVRVLPLRQLAMAMSPHAPNPTNTLLARLMQTGSMMIWLALVLWFAIKVVRDRSPRLETVGYPLRYSGGLFVACAGAGIFLGALTGMVGYGLIGGAVLGFIAARRAGGVVRPRWGRPSMMQLRGLVFVIGMEATLFALLGASGAFAHMPRLLLWETTLGIVGFHALLMRWSHGPIMAALGASVLVWLGIGHVLHLPLPVLAACDGLIKLGFGLAMAAPLLGGPTRSLSGDPDNKIIRQRGIFRRGSAGMF